VNALLEQSQGFSTGATGPSQLYFTALPTWTPRELEAHERKYAAFARQFQLEFGGAWMAGE